MAMECLKDSMEAYIESSTEPDFVEDELMYQDFPLTESLENVGRIKAHDIKVLLTLLPIKRLWVAVLACVKCMHASRGMC